MPKHTFDRKDRFYLRAKKEGYPARSAYKIMELDDQFKIFKRENIVVDLGCAPGGWLKVGEERLKGKGILVGIDLLPLQFTPQSSTHFLKGDFTDSKNQKWIEEIVPTKHVDWVISDLSPNISGVAFRDQCESVRLCQIALNFSLGVLKKGGSFLCKVFPGAEITELRNKIKLNFKTLKTIIPEATRKSSTEIYLVGLSFTSPASLPPTTTLA